MLSSEQVDRYQHDGYLFPLPALLQELDPLETLQDVAFSYDRAGSSGTAMLRHKIGNERAN